MFIKTAAKFYSIVYLLTCNCLGDDFMALETAVLDVVGNGVVTIGSIGSAEPINILKKSLKPNSF